ncbi:MAG: aminoacyl-tRNA hydrolase [Eubacterium sp.]|nr:aminoacyl-tRNA hydrolase [Eubacterium sp.]
MYIIAGLGNPDRKYENTRHNIGFDTVDALAQEYHIAINEVKHRAVCGSGFIAGQKVLLLKPLTYMNNSGEAVGAALHYYKLDPASELLVVYDDISLEPGNIRIRLKGSAGGHNGMKSIISHVGTQEFARIKVGVGAKPDGWDLADYVLGHFSEEERAAAQEAVKDAVAAAALLVGGDAAQAMNLYNKKKKP